MPYPEEPLHSFNFNRGLNAGRAQLSADLAGFAAIGSTNCKYIGEGYYEPYQGNQTQGAATGSRVMKPIGNTWGGIKDIGIILATGSVSEEINRSLWGI